MNVQAKQGRVAGSAGLADDLRPRPSRAPELHDPLNRFLYHPLAARLARLLMPTPVSPNAVSIVGGLMICAAAWAYTTLAWPVGALLGLAFHMTWHVVDGADGDLARLRDSASPTGELLDGVCDYVGHIVLYVALAEMLDDRLGGWAWAFAWLGALSHIAQTNHGESQRRAYLWWVYDVPWLRHARADRHEVFAGRSWFSRAFGWTGRHYLRLADLMAPHIARVDAAMAQAPGDAVARSRARRLVRRATRRSLLLMKLLGPNSRALILGFSMIATGEPLLFFLIELVPLNLLLVYSVLYHRRLGRRLLRERTAKLLTK